MPFFSWTFRAWFLKLISRLVAYISLESLLEIQDRGLQPDVLNEYQHFNKILTFICMLIKIKPLLQSSDLVFYIIPTKGSFVTH